MALNKKSLYTKGIPSLSVTIHEEEILNEVKSETSLPDSDDIESNYEKSDTKEIDFLPVDKPKLEMIKRHLTFYQSLKKERESGYHKSTERLLKAMSSWASSFTRVNPETRQSSKLDKSNTEKLNFFDQTLHNIQEATIEYKKSPYNYNKIGNHTIPDIVTSKPMKLNREGNVFYYQTAKKGMLFECKFEIVSDAEVKAISKASSHDIMDSEINYFTMNQEESLLVATNNNKTLKVYELKSMKVNNLIVTPWKILAVRVPQQNETLILVTEEGRIVTFDYINETTKSEHRLPQNFIMCVSFSHIGDRLLAGSKEGLVNLYEVATGTLKSTYQVSEYPINRLIFSPDDCHFIAGNEKHEFFFVRITSKPQKQSGNFREIKKKGTVINCIAFKGNYLELLAGTKDGKILVFDFLDKDKSPIDVISVQNTIIYIDVNNKSNFLFFVTIKGELFFYELKKFDYMITTKFQLESSPNFFKFDPNSNYILAMNDYSVNLLDVGLEKNQIDLDKKEQIIATCGTFSDDGKHLLIGYDNGLISLYTLGDDAFKLVNEQMQHKEKVHFVAFSNKRKRYYLTACNKKIIISKLSLRNQFYNKIFGEKLKGLDKLFKKQIPVVLKSENDSIKSIVFSVDGSKIYVLTSLELIVYSLKNQREITRNVINLDPSPPKIDNSGSNKDNYKEFLTIFSNDGYKFAVGYNMNRGNNNGKIKVYNTLSGMVLGTSMSLSDRQKFIFLGFNHDSSLLVSISSTLDVNLYETQDMERLKHVKLHKPENVNEATIACFDFNVDLCILADPNLSSIFFYYNSFNDSEQVSYTLKYLESYFDKEFDPTKFFDIEHGLIDNRMAILPFPLRVNLIQMSVAQFSKLEKERPQAKLKELLDTLREDEETRKSKKSIPFAREESLETNQRKKSIALNKSLVANLIKKRTVDPGDFITNDKLLYMIDEKNSFGLNTWDCCEYFIPRKEDRREALYKFLEFLFESIANGSTFDKLENPESLFIRIIHHFPGEIPTLLDSFFFNYKEPITLARPQNRIRPLLGTYQLPDTIYLSNLYNQVARVGDISSDVAMRLRIGLFIPQTRSQLLKKIGRLPPNHPIFRNESLGYILEERWVSNTFYFFKKDFLVYLAFMVLVFVNLIIIFPARVRHINEIRLKNIIQTMSIFLPASLLAFVGLNFIYFGYFIIKTLWHDKGGSNLKEKIQFATISNLLFFAFHFCYFFYPVLFFAKQNKISQIWYFLIPPGIFVQWIVGIIFKFVNLSTLMYFKPLMKALLPLQFLFSIVLAYYTDLLSCIEEITYASKLVFTDLILDYITICFLIYFAKSEYATLKAVQRRRDYFFSIWNILDMLIILLCPTSIILNFRSLYALTPDDSGDIVALKVLYALFVFVTWIRLIDFARGFAITAVYIRIFARVFRDMAGFLLIFFFIVFGFAFPTYLLQNDYDQYSPYQFMQFFYYILYGNFDSYLEAADSQGINTEFLFFILFIISLIGVIVLLNLLIAIISESFEKVMAIEKQASVYERLQLILESEYKMSERELADRDSQIKGRYMYLLENEETINQDDFEERVSTKVAEIKQTQEEMKIKMNDFMDKISKETEVFKELKEMLAAALEPSGNRMKKSDIFALPHSDSMIMKKETPLNQRDE